MADGNVVNSKYPHKYMRDRKLDKRSMRFGAEVPQGREELVDLYELGMQVKILREF